MNPRAMSSAEIQEVAEQLAQADRDARPVESLAHDPVDLADGYRIQEAARLLHHDPGDDDDLGVWKAGCTNDGVQRALGIDAPVFGRYRREHVAASPARWSFETFASPPHLEVEVGLRMVDDLDEIPDDALELAGAVEAFAAIEVVAPRLAAFPLVAVAHLVADNVASGRMIVGPTVARQEDDLRALDTVPVELIVDGERVASGTGAEAAGHPLLVLRDAAAHASVHGRPLRSGDLVITGTCTGLVAARRDVDHVARVSGAEVVVRFD